MAEEIRYDVDSFEIITDALLELINKYPGLKDGDFISFGSLSEETGKVMFPTSGAIIQNEVEDITGHVEQDCMYPFTILYRGAGLSESRKVAVKEWLDNIGAWLEKQEVTINGRQYRLLEYPKLVGDRYFKSIKRNSPSFQYSENEDRTEEWAITLTALYKNEYDKI